MQMLRTCVKKVKRTFFSIKSINSLPCPTLSTICTAVSVSSVAESIWSKSIMSQSAEAVEYTDCTSAER